MIKVILLILFKSKKKENYYAKVIILLSSFHFYYLKSVRNFLSQQLFLSGHDILNIKFLIHFPIISPSSKSY